MNLWANIKTASAGLLMAIIGCLGLVACDSVIYDYQGDCSVNYHIKFKYDYNMKFADAFGHEVKSVTLYLLDQDGNVVLKQTESGEALAAEDYVMVVNTNPGKYDLLVWCGTTDYGSFSVPETSIGSELGCTLKRKHDDNGAAYVDEPIDHLFYGYLPDQVFGEIEGTYVYTVDLVKNTNNVKVVLQNLSGETIESDYYDIKITDNNGKMSWQNELLDDEEITYHAWLKESVEVGTQAKAESNAAYTALLAELTFPRVHMDHSPMLTVTNNVTKKEVLSIPLADYILLVKGYANREMSDQEYLDRQDEVYMTFFLDKHDKWASASIQILSWKVVVQNTSI